MADFPNLLDEGKGSVMVGNMRISCLVWANDIVLLSDTEEGLSDSLTILSKYCNNNQLVVNKDKTKCMIFSAEDS